MQKNQVKKVSGLIRISKFINFSERKKIMKNFIEFQFGCYLLVWIFYRRQTNVRINHTHESALRAIYNY